jgi:tetratricopeptide (TPR) repeat protein
LDEEALAEASTLSPMVLRQPESRGGLVWVIDVGGVALIAALFLARTLARKTETPEFAAESAQSMKLFAIAGRFAPETVPDHLREAVAAVQLPPLASVDALRSETARAHMEWVRSGERSALDSAVVTARGVLDVLPPWHAARATALAQLSAVLRDRHTAFGSETDRDEAIDTARKSVRTASPTDPLRAHYLSCLATALNVSETGTPAERDEAVDAAVEAVRSATEPEAEFHQIKGSALLRRYWLVRNTADLDAAVNALQTADNMAGPRDSHAAGSRIQLGVAHYERFDQNRDPSDLDSSIDALRRGLRSGPVVAPLRIMALRCAGLALRDKAASVADLEESEGMFRAAAAAAEGTPASLGLQAEIGRACLALYRRSGDPDAVDRAVDAFRRDVEECENGVELGIALWALGEALSARLERTGRLPDADEAEVVLRRAVELLDGTSEPESRACRFHLGTVISGRFERTESSADLERAITIFRSLLKGDVTGKERSLVAGKLSHLLTRQYTITSDDEALTESIEWSRYALAASGEPGGTTRTIALAELGRALSFAFYRDGDLALLIESVEHLEAAAKNDLTYPLDVHVPYLLGTTLLAKAGRLGSTEDLNRSVALFREAADAVPHDHPDAANVLSSLCAVLVHRSGWTGRESDLHEAVALGRRAAEACAGAGPNARALVLDGLAAALAARYRWDWALSDLNEAVAIRKEIKALFPEEHLIGAQSRFELSAVLIYRYARLRDLADADEAVSAARTAVEATSEPRVRIVHLVMLSRALRIRGAYAERPEDALEAIEKLRESQELIPEDFPRPGHMFSELGSALMLRLVQTRDLSEADEVIDTFRTALADADENEPDHSDVVALYGSALTMRAAILEDARGTTEAQRAQADIDKARHLFARTASNSGAPAIARFHAAKGWVLTALERQDWEEALLAHRSALSLLPRLAWHGLELEDRFETLGSIEGLAGSAAAAAINARRPEEALQLLEEGRGVLLSQALDARDDMSALNERHPVLAARISGLRSALDAEPNDGTGPALPGMPLWDKRIAAERRRALAEELDEALQEARTLPGFEEFQRPPHIGRLCEAARGGPVVVVNTSRLRCDALIITQGRIRRIPLPRLKIEGKGGLDERAEKLLSALARSGSGAAAAAWGAHLTLVDTLEWLWKAVAEPVVTKLRQTGDLRSEDGEPPRLWWCPTGKLALLPLHAAGLYGSRRSPDAKGPQDLPSMAVCSYTATVRALADADPAPLGEALKVLVVEQSATPGLAPLPNATAEAAMLTEAVPDAVFLDGPRATREALLRELRSREVLHFAGHGGQGASAGPGGVLYCHDHEQAGPVTVPDIARLRLRGARLAYLSACGTAWGDADLADESMHLAGAMQLAGFEHVVAAQWSVSDSGAAAVADWFYKGLSSGGSAALDPGRSARALHAAVQALRSNDASPLHWAAYLHMGP